MEGIIFLSKNDIIQSFWHGPLTPIQHLCFASFLKNGHQIHLYAYETIAGLPEGVELKDARRILPEKKIFTYRRGKDRGNIAAFSNLFRYQLLYLKGGWWSDMDVICLKNLDFHQECLFVAQLHRNWKLRLVGKTVDDYVTNRAARYFEWVAWGCVLFRTV
jgi:Glycosyltransferase sugar-binding region containing DXD motif